MKWTCRIAAILFVFFIGYVATAVHSIVTIIDAAHRGDGSVIIERTDIRSVRSSVVDQVMDAYLESQGQKHRLSPLQRMAVNAYGTAIADSLVGKIMTPDNVSTLLRFGASKQVDGAPGIEGFPALTEIDVGRMYTLIGRVRPVKPVELFIQLGALDEGAGISLHFDGGIWKVSALRLPKSALRKLLERLPSP